MVTINFFWAFLLLAGSEAEGALERGLVGYWRFEEGKGEVASDLSGKGNHGKVHGARWVEGFVGGGLLFTSKGERVECPDSESLRLTEEITISAWMKPQPEMGGKAWGGVGKHLSYVLAVEPWHFRVGINDPEAHEADERGWIVITFWGPIHGTFSFFTMTYSVEDRTLRLFVNGREVAKKVTHGGDGRITVTHHPLVIGRFWEPFGGVIDEVRIYSRALSGEEIKALYGEGWRERAEQEVPKLLGRAREGKERLSFLAKFVGRKVEVEELRGLHEQILRAVGEVKAVMYNLATLVELKVEGKLPPSLEKEVREAAEVLGELPTPEVKKFSQKDAKRKLAQMTEEIEKEMRRLRRHKEEATFVASEEGGKIVIKGAEGKTVYEAKKFEEALQWAIDRAPDGSTIFVGKGEYRVTSPIWVKGKKGIRLLSDGAVLRSEVPLIGSYGHTLGTITIEGSEGVEVAGFRIIPEQEGMVPLDYQTPFGWKLWDDGAVRGVRAGACVSLFGSRNCFVHHNILGRTDKKGCGAHGILATEGSQGNIFSKNICAGFGWEGILVVLRSPDHIVWENFCAWNGLNGIYNDQWSHRLILCGNWCVWNGWNRCFHPDGRDAADNEGIQMMTHVYDVLVLNNICFGNRLRGILGWDGMDNLVLMGNYIERFSLDRSKGQVVLWNRIEGSFDVLSCSEVVILGNTCEEMFFGKLPDHGDPAEVFVVRNSVRGGKGVKVLHTNDFAFLFNEVKECKGNGLWVVAPSKNLCLMGNKFERNCQGEEVRASAEVLVSGAPWGKGVDLLIQGNEFETLTDRKVDAIYLTGCEKVYISGNAFRRVTGEKVNKAGFVASVKFVE